MIKELKNNKAIEYIKEIKDLLNDEDFWLDDVELRRDELSAIIDYIDKLELEHKKMSKRFRLSKDIKNKTINEIQKWITDATLEYGAYDKIIVKNVLTIIERYRWE